LLFLSGIVSGENKILNIILDTALLFVFFAVVEIKDKFFTLFFRRGK